MLVVDGAKDAADEAVLEEARRLAAIGHHRFVVASADSAFGQLADLGQMEIMLWQTQEPRKNAYTDRATRAYEERGGIHGQGPAGPDGGNGDTG